LTFDNDYPIIVIVVTTREMPYDEFRQLCVQHGLSVTHQRHLIFNALLRTSNHPSPESIYDQVKERIPSISPATVYKNIHTFVAHGLVREVSLHHGSMRIETNTVPHHHLVCSQCKAIVDVPDADVEPIRLRSQAPKGFRIDRYAVEFVGLCSACEKSHE
jgi:Fur family peroxide stress response transcriptional regulator